MGFYKNILCSGLLHSNDHPRTPDIQTYVGKRILAVMNDFQICKHLLVGEGDTDTVMFSPRFLWSVQVFAEVNLTINIIIWHSESDMV